VQQIDPYDTALLGNCQSALLVTRDANLVWGCLPTFQSPAVFAAILDERGGHFSISAQNGAPVSQRYFPLTNVVCTRFEGGEGEGVAWEVIDWMPRYFEGVTVQHPPTVHRLIRVLDGRPEVRISVKPRPGFGGSEVHARHLGNSILYECAGESFYLQSNLPLARLLNEETFSLRSDVVLSFSAGAPVPQHSLELSYTDLERTKQYWQRWSQHCYLPRDYQEPILRSALTLKMLTFEDTGAVIAAPTTSLPEVRGGVRNWDYRYCWLRDSFFVVRALARLAQFEEESRYLSFLEQLPLKPGRLQPVYGIAGESDLNERTLDHLGGAFDSTPVRVGNQAFEHLQNDVYGELMLTLVPVFFDVRFATTGHRKLLWQLVEHLAEETMSVWRNEDAGIWEYRDLPDHYVFSKLMCWVSLDRATQVARSIGEDAKAKRWSDEARIIQDEINTRGWNEEIGAFVGAYDGETLDAANLLFAHTGFVGPKDPRYLRTLQAIEKRLVTEDGLCFRYRMADDFGTPDATFSICTFWYVDALRITGQHERAREVFEAMLARANHVGLFSEGIHATQGFCTGNFPQGYTHVAIINSGMMLSRNWGEVGGRHFTDHEMDSR
jgi:alpha,alpha-trehalase